MFACISITGSRLVDFCCFLSCQEVTSQVVDGHACFQHQSVLFNRIKQKGRPYLKNYDLKHKLHLAMEVDGNNELLQR